MPLGTLLEISGAEKNCSWTALGQSTKNFEADIDFQAPQDEGAGGGGEPVRRRGFGGIQTILYCKIQHSGLRGLGAPVEAS